MQSTKNFINCICKGQIIRTDMRTGQVTSMILKIDRFMIGMDWCDCNSGRLLLAGGENSMVLCIETQREFALTLMAPMPCPQSGHRTAYYEGYFYVIGGANQLMRNECSRLSLSENQWEDLPALPHPCSDLSLVVIKATSSLYAFGGNFNCIDLNVIQRLSIETLSWELLSVKLPSPTSYIVSFTQDDHQAIIAIQSDVYVFDSLSNEIHQVASLRKPVNSYAGPSYYHSGRIFIAGFTGPAKIVHLLPSPILSV